MKFGERFGSVSEHEDPADHPDAPGKNNIPEKIVETFDREALEKAVHDSASDVNDETILLLHPGADRWDLHEFGPQIDASLHHKPRTEAKLKRMHEILVEIKKIAGADAQEKIAEIKTLWDEFWEPE